MNRIYGMYRMKKLVFLVDNLLRISSLKKYIHEGGGK
jgi:hypothetical protein